MRRGAIRWIANLPRGILVLAKLKFQSIVSMLLALCAWMHCAIETDWDRLPGAQIRVGVVHMRGMRVYMLLAPITEYTIEQELHTSRRPPEARTSRRGTSAPPWQAQ